MSKLDAQINEWQRRKKKCLLRLLSIMTELLITKTCLDTYDEIIDWKVDTRGRGLMLMGECGLPKSTILRTIVIPANLEPKQIKGLKTFLLRCISK